MFSNYISASQRCTRLSDATYSAFDVTMDTRYSEWTMGVSVRAGAGGPVGGA